MNPQLEDYEEKLKQFEENHAEVDAIDDYHQIGALSLKTHNVKVGLKKWIDQWKGVYSRDLHKKAKSLLESLTDEIKQITLKIDKKVQINEIDSLGSVMMALEEIRKKQSDIALQFKPVNDMYNLIENYFADIMDKEEMDSYNILQNKWDDLLKKAEVKRDELQSMQSQYKCTLNKNIAALIEDVVELRKNFEEHGPMVPGIEPRDALQRLVAFRDEYSVRKRRYDSYYAGETLFGLPHQSYPALMKTESEILLLDKLYNLYSKVKDSITKWNDVLWSDIGNEIEKMTESVEQFSRDCTRLPGILKSWPAYKDLKKEIDDKTEQLPLVEALAKPSIRDRHWEEIIELAKEDIPYQSETFMLKDLIKPFLLEIQEDVIDITDNADKQLKLEKTLREEISQYWEDATLQINNWKGVDVPCTLGGDITEIKEKLEDDIN